MQRTRYAHFDGKSFDLVKGLLIEHGDHISLEPKIQEFLRLLLTSTDEIVTKEQVLAALWDDPEKADERLRALVKKTREALGDNARAPNYLKTIPKKGYVFLPEVEFTDAIDVDRSEQPAQSRLPPPPKAIKGNRWVALALILIVSASVAYFLQDDAIPEMTAVEFERSTLLSAQQNQQVFALSDDVFLIFQEGNETLSVFLSDHDDSIFAFELKNKIPTFSGISLDKTHGYLVVENQDEIRFNFWRIQTESINSISSVVLPFTPSEILGFDSERNALFAIVRQDQQPSVIKYSLDLPSSMDVIEVQLSDNLTSLSLNQRADTLVAVTANLTRSTITVTDLIQVGSRTTSLNVVIEQSLWAQDGKSILLKDIHGRLFSLQPSTLELISWQGRLNRNDRLVSTCGVSCVIVERAANDTVLIRQALLEVNSTQLSMLEQVIDLSLIDSLAVDGDIIYASVFRDNRAEIVSIQNRQATVLLSRADVDGIKHLRLNPTASMITGSASGQVFLFDLDTREFRFLDIPMSNVGFPLFDVNDSNLLYFASLDPRFNHAAFVFNINHGTYEKVASDRLIDMQLTDRVKLTLDARGQLVLSNQTQTLFAKRLRRYSEFTFNHQWLAVIGDDAIQFVDYSSDEVSEFGLPQTFDRDVFGIDWTSNQVVYSMNPSNTRQIVKLEQIKKVY